jgi:hypothetical protein
MAAQASPEELLKAGLRIPFLLYTRVEEVLAIFAFLKDLSASSYDTEDQNHSLSKAWHAASDNQRPCCIHPLKHLDILIRSLLLGHSL